MRKHFHFLKQQQGFSIIEMMLYMGILAIMLGVLSTLFTSAVQMQLQSDSTSSVEQTGNYLLQRLIYDIHNADSITTPATLGGSDDTLVITNGSTTYTYTLDSNGNLTINDVPLNDFDTTISNLSFTRLGNDLSDDNDIQIQFTVTSKVKSPSGTETKDYKTTVGIRT